MRNYFNQSKNWAEIAYKQFRYSLKIIFANKFVYFLLAAVLFFLFIVTVNLFSSSNFDSGDVYATLIFPGILLVFYPAAFGIQNDEDAGMLENIFAIPNYRFKVWLPRLMMMFILVAALLMVLALLSSVTLAVIPLFEMVFQLMFPILFIGSLAFSLSTLVRNGNGTAVIMVIIGLIFWILTDLLEQSEWNIFLNPFHSPGELSDSIWETIIYRNRLYLSAGTILALLLGLFNLQKREKFV